MRVVSLLPSSTEIVAALGRGGELVGRSHECDYPADLVRALPVLTRPRLDVRGSSRDVNGRVRELRRERLPLYRIDEGELKRLQPDVILTQAQCEVCAVSYQEVEDAAHRLLGEEVRVVPLQPRKWDDVVSDVIRVADALGDRPGGMRLIDQLSLRVEAVQESVAVAPSPRVLCIEWMDPLVEAGNWMPELIEWAGGAPLFALPGAPSPVVDWDDVLDADPEVIIVAPCGFSLDETSADLDALRGRPGWRSLQAVRERRVFALDGNAYVNRAGPRLVDTLELVAALAHPDLFPAPPPARFRSLAS